MEKIKITIGEDQIISGLIKSKIEILKEKKFGLIGSLDGLSNKEDLAKVEFLRNSIFDLQNLSAKFDYLFEI